MYAISKRQAGVIYRAWKEGYITAEKATINAMYEMVGDFLKGTLTARNMDGCLDRAVRYLGSNCIKRAQEEIDRFAELAAL